MVLILSSLYLDTFMTMPTGKKQPQDVHYDTKLKHAAE